MKKMFILLAIALLLLGACSTKEEPKISPLPCPSCPPCPDVMGKLYDGPPCIYDDLMGYKRFRIVYEDGRVCYGLKPYDKAEPSLFSCIEKGK